MTTTKTMAAPEFLRAVFTATARTPTDELRYAEVGLGLGTKPWWPPLIEVWLHGPSPPSEWNGEGREDIWRAAYEFLAAIHADFEAARRASEKQRAKRKTSGPSGSRSKKIGAKS